VCLRHAYKRDELGTRKRSCCAIAAFSRCFGVNLFVEREGCVAGGDSSRYAYITSE
jgi:hypothetical protein